jgi:hypothetical protein
MISAFRSFLLIPTFCGVAMRKPCYLAGRNGKVRYQDVADITRIAENCQEVFVRTAKTLSDTPFGARLRQAFGGLKDTEIARKLGKAPSDVGKWTKRDALPMPPILLEIARITKCNLHWLLTGDGEADLDPFQFLDEPTRGVIQKIADDDEKDFEEVVGTLLTEALAGRGAQLFALYPRLRGKDLDQMRLLVTLFEDDEKRETANPSATSRRRSAG